MIRIKAPRLWVSPNGYVCRRDARMVHTGPVACGRLYTEAMHRRVVALVRACDANSPSPEFKRDRLDIWYALEALRAQAEKEAK